MAEDILTNTGMAAIAYRDALTAAKNTQNALLRQYGFTMPGAGGQYTVESAQSAFDPNTLFDQSTGGINQARLQELAGRVQVGGTGLLSDIMRGGGAAEAEQVMASRGRGIAGGGLAAQRRALVEAQTSGQLGEAKQEFITGIGQALAPVSGAYSELEQARVRDRLLAEQAAAARETLPSVGTDIYQTMVEPSVEAPQASAVMPNKPNKAGGVLPPASRGNYKQKVQPKGAVPKNPKPGQTFQGKSGVTSVYRPQGPAGAGWYKKKK